MVRTVHTLVSRVLFVSAIAALAAPAAAVPITATSTSGVSIPDSVVQHGPGATATSSILIADSGIINDFSLTLTIPHTWPGDLIIKLVKDSTVLTLMNRPNFGSGTFERNFVASRPITFDDDAVESINDIPTNCVFGGATDCPTVYRPIDSLSNLDGLDIAGLWTLEITDNYLGDTGRLESWTINADVSPATTVPEPATITLLGLGLAGGLVRRRRASSRV